MKAVLQFRAGDSLRKQLESLQPSWLEIAIVDETDDRGLSHELQDADVLLHVLRPVTADVIAAAPKLKLIQKIGVGVNTIDLVAARARGISVADMPGSNSQAVAEMTLALMFAVLRRIVTVDRQCRSGEGWRLPPDFVDEVGEIGGRTIGLVGFGDVPGKLVPVLRALGANVVYHARRKRSDDPTSWRPLDEVFETADIVSLHVPLTPETSHIVDARALARFKPGAILINTARGGLVDEAALIEALRCGRLRGAGLDVFAVEPAAANPLFALANVVVAPHIAWLTPETFHRSFSIAIENCRRLSAGEQLLNLVSGTS